MTFHLADIMDLEYLLALDEQVDTPEQTRAVAARDRDIFRQLDAADMSDADLLLSWLSFRKLVFFDQAGHKGQARLPGRVYAGLWRWMAYGLAFFGGLAGLALSYTFLAYHGVRPVNVALFFSIFILVPAVLFLVTLAGLVIRRFRRSGPGHGVFYTLVSGFLFRMLPRLLEKIWARTGKVETGKDKAFLDEVIFFINSKKNAYGFLFFWPVVILVSVFALFFSFGALGGTLFRVAVSDVAFGWQSTLAATPSVVHDLVSLVSFPWAAWVPDYLSGPTPAQIEGSRIILKQGIASLSTGDLVSWWPFLCLGMVFYAVLPRLVLIAGAVAAQRMCLHRFDFHQPRFRRLLVRMKSPVMDIGFTETSGDLHAFKPVQPQEHRPRQKHQDHQDHLPDHPGHAIHYTADSNVQPRQNKTENQVSGTGAGVAADMVIGTPAVVLAPASIWDKDALDRILQLLRRQFLLDVHTVIPIALDPDTDPGLLTPAILDGADPVVLLQEVWQPPIRGLLHYLVQLKQGVLHDKNLWVLLTRAPEEENPGVADGDMDFTVWQTSVGKLGYPDILVERIRP